MRQVSLTFRAIMKANELNPAVLKAAKKAGGVQKLAEALGVTTNAIYQWKDRVPAKRCAEIEKATGVKRKELRPDLFG